MYLFIHDDASVTQGDAITEDDILCVDAGILDIVRLSKGSFERFTGGPEWRPVPEQPCLTSINKTANISNPKSTN